MEIDIVKALPSDAEMLTRIAFAAKRHWGYPEEYYAIWAPELTVTEGYIEKEMVYIAKVNGQAVGFFAITEAAEDAWSGEVIIEKGFYLDHLFIDPPFIRQGIGAQMIRFALCIAKARGIKNLRLFSDPNARGFYEKMGAKHICESPSSIPNRTLPIFELSVE